MADFFGVMVFVFGGLLVIASLLAAVFAMIASPKKKQVIEDKHKLAKKISNICALIALGSIVLGILCGILNNVMKQNERKQYVDNILFSEQDDGNDSDVHF